MRMAVVVADNAKSCGALVKTETGSASAEKVIVGDTERRAKGRFAEMYAPN